MQISTMQASSLAVKYRPTKLEHLAGNEAVVAQLSGMVQSRTFPSAIMISGGYGMGKTTLARVIGRYINCETHDSCGTCLNCLNMDKGLCSDYTELDNAASGGVAGMRELIERCGFLPRAFLRIYTMDEVHRLTGAAEEAFLKTLEEPPKRTLFILCTNQPDKVLATIKSRCTRIEVKAPTEEQMAKKLWEIAGYEGHNITREDTAGRQVLFDIAKLSGGHMRDAIQMLQSYLAIRGRGDYSIDDIIKNYFSDESANLDLIALNCLVYCAQGKPKGVVAELVEASDKVRAVIYKMRFLADNITAAWAGVGKFQTPGCREFLKQVKPSIHFLSNIQSSLVDLESKLNTVPGLDERIGLQASLVAVSIREHARLNSQQQG